MAGNWWGPQQQTLSLPLPPTDAWRVLPSTPSPTATTCSDNQSNAFWHDTSIHAFQLPSPTPSFSNPVYTSAPAQYYSSPECMTLMPTMSLPSMMNCGVDMSMSGFNDFAWGQNTFMNQYATPV